MSLFSRIFRRDEAGGEAGPGSEPKEGAQAGDGQDGAASAAEPATSADSAAESAASSPEAQGTKAPAGEPASAQPEDTAAVPAKPKSDAGAASDKVAKDQDSPAQPQPTARAQPQGPAAPAAPSAEKKAATAPKPLPTPPALGGADGRSRVSAPQISSAASADKRPPTKKTLNEPARPAGTASKPDAPTTTDPGPATARAKSPVAGSTAKTMPMGTVARPDTGSQAQSAAAAQATTSTHTATTRAATGGQTAVVASAAGAQSSATSAAVGLAQFKDAAAPSVRALIDFMLEVAREGCAPSAWVSSCLASLRTLAPLAAKLDAPTVKQSFDTLLAALERIGGKSELGAATRTELLRCCSKFAEQMGFAVSLEAERARRSSALVGALLGQVEGVYAQTAQKIVAAGFASVERFAQSTSDELVRGTGLDPDVAERVLASFRSFSAEFPASLEPSRDLEKRRLAALLEELRALEQRFERASAGWSNEDLAARRALRRERARSVQRIHAVLARVGELERIALLERLPYAAKVEHLASYLARA